MSFRRILAAVDDSPAALRAAEVAIGLAEDWDAAIRLVTVTADHVVGTLLDTTAETRGQERVEEAGRALLHHLADAARSKGLEHETARLVGEPFRLVLDDARSWGADLIVIGRSDRRGPSSPYLGSVTEHVLEFADCPVLVVPRTVPPAAAVDSAD